MKHLHEKLTIYYTNKSQIGWAHNPYGKKEVTAERLSEIFDELIAEEEDFKEFKCHQTVKGKDDDCFEFASVLWGKETPEFPIAITIPLPDGVNEPRSESYGDLLNVAYIEQ